MSIPFSNPLTFSYIPLSLTAKGRIYIESIEEMLEIENNMRKKQKAYICKPFVFIVRFNRID